MVCASAVAAVASAIYRCCVSDYYCIVRALAGAAAVFVAVALLACIRAGAGAFPQIIRARSVPFGRGGNGSCARLSTSVCVTAIAKLPGLRVQAATTGSVDKRVLIMFERMLILVTSETACLVYTDCSCASGRRKQSAEYRGVAGRQRSTGCRNHIPVKPIKRTAVTYQVPGMTG